MMDLCGCDMASLGAPPQTTVKSMEIQMLDGMNMDANTGQLLKDAKARTYVGANVIQIDKAWWAGLSHVQRDAVLAHEISHHDDAQACEPCTDARAGSRLRHLGYSREAATSAVSSLVSNRRRSGEWNPEAVGNGWDAADAWLEDRADTVQPGALWSYQGSLSPDSAFSSSESFDDDGQQSVGVPDVDGQSIGDPDVSVDDGQSIGQPAPSTPRTPPRTTTTPPAKAPDKKKEPAKSQTLLFAGMALIVIAIVLIYKKKG